jgi:hypothetical protein
MLLLEPIAVGRMELRNRVMITGHEPDAELYFSLKGRTPTSCGLGTAWRPAPFSRPCGKARRGPRRLSRPDAAAAGVLIGTFGLVATSLHGDGRPGPCRALKGFQ